MIELAVTEPDDAVIVAVPTSFAVNTPDELIVPTVVLLLFHVGIIDTMLPFASLPVAMNCWVCCGVILILLGKMVMFASEPSSTVTVAVPLTEPDAAVTMVVPTPVAVNSPDGVIVPVVVLLWLHIGVTDTILPFASLPVAVNCWV